MPRLAGDPREEIQAAALELFASERICPDESA